jgi:uncharacterized protein
MLIRPIDIQDEPLGIDTHLDPKAMEYTPDVRQAGPLHVTGEADLLVEHRGHKEIVEDIRLRAGYQGRFELLCARCLDPIEQELNGSFDLIFRPQDADSESGERAISEEETEIGYYEKSGLLLEDVVREQVLLSLPSRTLCGPDCKGLCQHCGQNLNQATCDCGETPADPRWNALAGLAQNLPAKPN